MDFKLNFKCLHSSVVPLTKSNLLKVTAQKSIAFDIDGVITFISQRESNCAGFDQQLCNRLASLDTTKRQQEMKNEEFNHKTIANFYHLKESKELQFTLYLHKFPTISTSTFFPDLISPGSLKKAILKNF
ncbi:CLUMA_CG000493, isoform A [Clunio marinus]|uniref:CLUMA_CG000493, isoform A n=1 Tax=Clunio marinus TaxID=568069 RepID=A0A1J1HK84_9DIPT|nr:CLUMA_CG000493, isoform A [Clunio marinus]